MNDGPLPEDGGRQFERTGLAWVRTGLAVTAVALLLVRESGAGPRRVVVSVAAVGALALALAIAVVRSERLIERPRRAQAQRWQTRGLVIALLVLQLAGLVIVW